MYAILLAATTLLGLAVGDAAPPLEVGQWLHDARPSIGERGKVTVVEFWATWCGPCVANIAHLTALQKKYASRGLVVVGATSADDWGNDAAAVRKLMAAKGAQFDYAVAMLPATKGIHRNPWFRAAGVEWLPCVFVIDRAGKVAFIGDPTQLPDVLPAILDGRWDMAAARAKYEAGAEARALMAKMKVKGISRDETVRLAQRVLGGRHDDAHTYFAVADFLSHSAWAEDRQVLDVALDAAQRAVALSKGESSGMLDALAHIWFVRGDAGKAIEVEKRAIAKSEGAMREAQMKNLRTYLSAR